MHSFDSLARSLAQPAPPAARLRPPRRGGSILSPIFAICCALVPLAFVSHAYLATA